MQQIKDLFVLKLVSNKLLYNVSSFTKVLTEYLEKYFQNVYFGYKIKKFEFQDSYSLISN